MRVMSQPEPPDDPLASGPALNAAGHLERRLARIEPQGAPAPPEAAGPALELAERAPKRPEAPPGSYRAPLPNFRRRLAVRLVVAGVVLGLVLFAGALASSRRRGATPGDTVRSATILDQLLAGGPRAPVVITSEPPGATVRVGSDVVGQTPWAGDNVWVGELPVVVELEGFRPWKGSLRGGEETRLDARLKK